MGTQGHESETWDYIKKKGIDIGHNVVIMPTGRKGVNGSCGLLLYHLHADGSVCGGGCTFDIPQNLDITRLKWQVLSWDPLTLTPSIADYTCSENLHGYITAGRWVPC